MKVSYYHGRRCEECKRMFLVKMVMDGLTWAVRTGGPFACEPCLKKLRKRKTKAA